MNPEQRLLIKKNLDIVLRRKKLIIFCLLIGIVGGLGHYLKLPKIYKCTALIKYQRQSVNPTIMSPDDNRTRTQEMINTVREQITSRTSLEGIITEFDLYKNMRGGVPMEKLVGTMRRNHIQTRILDGGNVFEVSYLGLHQQQVMDVTNALAQKFIEENLRFRQEQATKTSSYIHDELQMAKQALDQKEEIMRDYKLRYYNEMSDQLLNNTSRLNGLQEQYQNLQTSRLELERTRLLVHQQIAERVSIVSQQLAESAASSPTQTANVSTIEQIKIRLQSLQPRYTDNHPEVKRLKKLLQNLESQESSETTAGQATQDQQMRRLRQQLNDIDFNISRLNNERQSLAKQISQYEQWISAAPIREAEWSALTRDYDQLNEHYERLVTQSLQAESAQSLEKQMQGSQFNIIDSAHYPEKPLEPDFNRIFLIAVALGLGTGAALSFGFELLGTSFKEPSEVENYLDIPVICALPNILTKKEVARKRMLNLLSSTFLLLLAGTIGYLIYYYTEQGMIIL